MPDNLHIDFASNANTYRRLHGGGTGQAIAKAAGLKTYGLPLRIIDATAGLGQDAFVLACLGCEVTMFERAPVIANALNQALQHGRVNPDIAPIMARLRLVEGNAIEMLANLKAEDYPDVIYLDPMFPEQNKSALSKQSLRHLKEIVGDDLDADKLLVIALQRAKRRIVVKRPKIAPFLNNLQPHSQLVGSANRFDIYMPQKL